MAEGDVGRVLKEDTGISMTREEAVKFAEHAVNITGISEVKEFYRMAAAALTPPTQEQTERVWLGCEWCNGEHSNDGEISAYAEVECEGCDAGGDCPNAHSSEDPCYGLVDRALPVNSCPVCGRPLTPAAWEELRKRLEALYENIHNT